MSKAATLDAIQSSLAMETARDDWMDSMGCALLAPKYPAYTKLLGPIIPEASLKGGARISPILS